jgi:epsin
VSSPSVPATSVPAEQVNGVHDNTVEDVPAPPTAHAEPNGFDEFDPRGSVPGIACSFFGSKYITRVN